LKADHDGVRGTLFNQNWLEINLSFNVTTPVRNDRERSGMPDLQSTVELGPSFDLHLFRSNDARVKLDLRMPLRAAATVELAPRVIGWTFTPRLNLDIEDPFGFDGWRLGLLTGPLFANRPYHEYFYSVAPQYATATRPAFQAEGGYAGTQMLAALSKRYPKFWMGAYMRYDTLAGAVFVESPLVQRQSFWTAGFGFAWIIKASSQLVEVPD
jgi:outer membrane scaffolding protein for murein synthesis (MipA/OmpV family)